MRLFKLHIISEKEYVDNLEAHYTLGIRHWHERVDQQIALAKEAGYNEGKAEGIAIAKRAFAKALKQKGESNNDVLRQHQGR